MAEIKVNKFDVSALKQVLDDAVVKYITEERNYEEDHSLSNIKLLLGAFGCVVAVVAHFYPTSFPENRHILLICAIGYFISSGILQYIASYLQQDVILFAKPVSVGKPLEISSHMHKYDPSYTLTMKYKEGKPCVSFTKKVTDWFNVDGVLVSDVFTRQVAQTLGQLASKIE